MRGWEAGWEEARAAVGREAVGSVQWERRAAGRGTGAEMAARADEEVVTEVGAKAAQGWEASVARGWEVEGLAAPGWEAPGWEEARAVVGWVVWVKEEPGWEEPG